MQLYLTGKAATEADVCSETVRAYCLQGLLNPLRDSAGRRLFTERDVQRIREIYLANMTRRPMVREELLDGS